MSDHALDPVWKALSDPSRRSLLDLLRDGPRTTGELAAQFEMSRYGVMKHLGVLEQAGLIVVRRRGRERFNHLNAVPIRQIYERWVGRYAEHWSSSLLNLKAIAEAQAPRENNMKKNSNGQGLDSYEIVQEVRIDKPKSDVWTALTTDIGKWWAFSIIDGNSTLTLDGKLGGHFKEESDLGEGAIWGTVIRLKPNKMLGLEGPLGMGQSAIKSVYTYELEEADGGTLLKLRHEVFGRMEPESGERYNEGWKMLLGKYLKGWLEEGRTAAQIMADSPA